MRSPRLMYPHSSPRVCDPDIYTEEDPADRKLLYGNSITLMTKTSVTKNLFLDSHVTPTTTLPISEAQNTQVGNDKVLPQLKERVTAAITPQSTAPNITAQKFSYRPHSPVSDYPTETVISPRIRGKGRTPRFNCYDRERSPRISPWKSRGCLTDTDVAKISSWLETLKSNHIQYPSYFLYCEVLFRESAILTQGKPTPNRLQTAIAFHCLVKARSIFSLHEDVFAKIIHGIEAAIYMKNENMSHSHGIKCHDPNICSNIGQSCRSLQWMSSRSDPDVLQYYEQNMTYYDYKCKLEGQEIAQQNKLANLEAEYQNRLNIEEQLKKQIQTLEARYQIKSLDAVSHHNTATMTLKQKLISLLEKFEAILGNDEKQEILLCVANALQISINPVTFIYMTENYSRPQDREELMRLLYDEKVQALTEKIQADLRSQNVIHQNVIIEQSVLRITKFQDILSQVLQERLLPQLIDSDTTGSSQRQPDQSTDAEGTTVELHYNKIEQGELDQQDIGNREIASNPNAVEQEDAITKALLDPDLCESDRKILETAIDTLDDLKAERKKNRELETKVKEMEEALTSLAKNADADANYLNEEKSRHEKELESLKTELDKVKTLKMEDKSLQTDRVWLENQEDNSFGNTDDVPFRKPSRQNRKSKSVAQQIKNDDLDATVGSQTSPRRTGKIGWGILRLINDAKIPGTKIRKILGKRKPLSLAELHTVIIGYYQAKIVQDLQDDMTGKPHSNLAQFIIDMYTLHYGLKDLAVSYLVYLNESVKKYASSSARVRTFGLLTGCLEADTHACSSQGIDFFNLVLVIIFNMGNVKKGRKQAENISKQLRKYFGDGIPSSPTSACVKIDLLYQCIDLVFSFNGDEWSNLEKLKLSLHEPIASQGINPLKWNENDVIEEQALHTSMDTRTSTTRNITEDTSMRSQDIDVDVALEKIMNYWFIIYEEQIQDLHNMFLLVDANGDGTLDFIEFCEVIAILEPTMNRKDALTLYNRTAGDDHVIDKDEFVQVMLGYQRDLLLKSFYSGNSSKKIIEGIHQRASSLLHGVVANQKEGFSGLKDHNPETSAFESMLDMMKTTSESSLENIYEHDSFDEDFDDNDVKAVLEKNVSFKTMSQLSGWAQEARNKLQNSKLAKDKINKAKSYIDPSNAIASFDENLEQLMNKNSTLTVSSCLAEEDELEDDFKQNVNEIYQKTLAKVDYGAES